MYFRPPITMFTTILHPSHHACIKARIKVQTVQTSADGVYTPNYLIFNTLQTIVQSVDKIAFFLCIARTQQ